MSDKNVFVSFLYRFVSKRRKFINVTFDPGKAVPTYEEGVAEDAVLFLSAS